MRAAAVALVGLGALFTRGIGPHRAEAQQPGREQAFERGHRILAQIKRDVDQRYYDSTFRGADLEARYRAYDARLDNAASVPQIFANIAQFLLDLNDSHTFFIPPALAGRVEYGWAWQMIGDSCYVVGLTSGSDADSQGLARGDRVIAIDGNVPTRRNLWLINYAYYRLRPRPGMHLRIEKPDGTRHEFDVLARIQRGSPILDLTRQETIHELIEASETAAHYRAPVVEFGDTAMVWYLASFGGDEQGNDAVLNRARRHRALILDLRDNGGGSVATMLRLVGNFFDHDLLVATTRTRTRTDSMIARRVGREPFSGVLVVLINSGSASASELTSKILQLEERAIVVGDRSAGAVMGAGRYQHEVGSSERVLVYAVSITEIDAIMPDGTRLENQGVTPTEVILPTAADLAARRDPQMARALELVGITMSPEDAYRIYERRR